MFISVAMIKKVIYHQATITPTVEREHDSLLEFQSNSLCLSFFLKKKTNCQVLWRRTISPQSTRKRKKKNTLRLACGRHHPMQRDTGALKPCRAMVW
jgi:hypothetical protein